MPMIRESEEAHSHAHDQSAGLLFFVFAGISRVVMTPTTNFRR